MAALSEHQREYLRQVSEAVVSFLRGHGYTGNLDPLPSDAIAQRRTVTVRKDRGDEFTVTLDLDPKTWTVTVDGTLGIDRQDLKLDLSKVLLKHRS